ncbi:MAG: archease [Calditrichia bacterium]
MRRFKEIDHTADVGFEIEGKNIENLFLAGLEALYNYIFQKETFIAQMEDLSDDHTKPLLMSAPTLEDLLVLWLSDMHYKIEVYQDIMVGFSQLQIVEYKEYSQLEGKFVYKNVKDLEWKIENEIKAVTYHKLEIRRQGNIFKTNVILDI